MTIQTDTPVMNMQNSRSHVSASGFTIAANVAGLRWPAERRTFWMTLFIATVGVALFSSISLGVLALVVAGSVVLGWVLTRVTHAGLLGSSVRVTANHMPRLAALFQDCAGRLRPPLVQGFVAQNPNLNAYAFGLSAPQAIVLYSGLVDHLDDDELRFVIGHEMGHVLFHHTRINSVVGGLAGVPDIPFLSMIVGLILLGWSRCAEFSADRAGLLACGRLDKAQSAIVKLMIGPRLAAFVNVAELEKQADDLRHNPLAWLGQLGHQHPFSVHRLCELRKFAESAAFAQAMAAQI